MDKPFHSFSTLSVEELNRMHRQYSLSFIVNDGLVSKVSVEEQLFEEKENEYGVQ